MPNLSRNKTLRQAVVAGILASVIVIVFIEPILVWLWGVISDSTLSFWEGLIDRAYTNASLGRRSLSAFFVLVLIVGLLLNAILFLAFLRPIVEPRIKSKLKKILDKGPVAEKRLLVSLRVLNLVAACWLTFTLLLILMLAIVDFQLNSSFERRMAALNPAISDEKAEEIRALWANMDSKKKYQEIQEMMEELAEGNDIVLPEQLLK